MTDKGKIDPEVQRRAQEKLAMERAEREIDKEDRRIGRITTRDNEYEIR